MSTWPHWIDLSQGVPIDEDYRAQFERCDLENTFRDYALPIRNDAGKIRYYGCSTDKNRVTCLLKLPGGAIAFSSKLGVDLDGSWYACNTPGLTDLCHTSLMLPARGGSLVPVDSDRVPYVVIPMSGPTREAGAEFRTKTKIDKGDFGVVIKEDKIVPVVVADGGPFNKLGEGSMALHRALGRELCAQRDAHGNCTKIKSPLSSIDQDVVTILFPNSAQAVTASNVASVTKTEGTRLWKEVRDSVGRPGDEPTA